MLSTARTPTPDVVAVVLNWNAADATERCAASVLASVGVGADLLIVDNASADGSGARLATRFGEARVLRLPENRGYAGGMNAAMDACLTSGAKYVLLLTQDVVLEPGTLRRLVEVADRAEKVAVAAPFVRFLAPSGETYSAGGYVDVSAVQLGQLKEALAEEPYEVPWVDGCCMLVRRDFLEAAGGFDELYFMYFEENDLCHRARRSGWRVLMVPGARVAQEKPLMPGGHYFYYMSRNRFVFWKRYYGISFGAVARALVSEWLGGVTALLQAVIEPAKGPVGLRFRWVVLQGWGAILGTVDHLRGHYGYRHFGPRSAHPSGRPLHHA